MPKIRHPSRRRSSDFSAHEERSVSFLTVWIVHLGRRFRLIQTLATLDSPVESDRLAKLCSLHAPTVARWCEAAHAHRILERRTSGYLLPRRLRPLIADEDHLDYIAGQFSYLALRSLDYDAFDELFRKGVASPRSPHLSEASAEATRWDHTAFEEIVLPRIPGLRNVMTSGARILDLGCGRGEWDVRFARLYPKCRFVGIDPDRRAVSLARTKAQEAAVAGRVTLKHGAGESVGLLGSFDIVHLGEVLSAIAAKEEVLRNCHRLLRPSGFLVIAEGLKEPKRARTPTGQLIQGMELDFALQGTGFFTRANLRTLLQRSGFARPRYVHAGGGLWYVVARK